MNKRIKDLFNIFSRTPLHPQWLAFLHDKRLYSLITEFASGRVIDIGSGEQQARNHLMCECEYISIDYYVTARDWYGTKPDIYANASVLPLMTECADTVLLLDVLEHLPDPESSITEIYRILKPGKGFIIQIPFMYPVHDAPLDFTRWTPYGLKRLMQKTGFVVEEEDIYGSSVETAALFLNLAFCYSLIKLVKSKHPAMIFILLAPIFVPLVNISGWLLSLMLPKDDFMPIGLRYFLIKSDQ